MTEPSNDTMLLPPNLESETTLVQQAPVKKSARKKRVGKQVDAVAVAPSSSSRDDVAVRQSPSPVVAATAVPATSASDSAVKAKNKKRKKNGRDDGSTSDDERRRRHNEVEIRRRQKMSQKFNELKELTRCGNKHKIAVLEATVDRLHELQTGTWVNGTRMDRHGEPTDPVSGSLVPNAVPFACNMLPDDTIVVDQKCILCTTKCANTAFLPCGHSRLCTSCYNLSRDVVKNCVACRLPIESVVPLLRPSDPQLLEKYGYKCTICKEKEKSPLVLFQPCHHFWYCQDCSKEWRDCPRCNVEITSRIIVRKQISVTSKDIEDNR